MVRGFVGHGLGYSLLATKPANNMTYDGRALVARPLTGAVKNSRLVLVTLKGRSMSAMALEFAEHCRALFGINHAHPDGHGKAPPAQYAPGGAQS
jgi:DNA-binding transcriptional LysR family regulator